MIRNITKFIVSFNKKKVILRNKTNVSVLNEKNIEELNLETVEVVEENDQSKTEEIERKRNKSRLQTQHRNILKNNMPYSEPLIDFHKTVKYQRKMFGKHGNASEVNPGICWPTKSEIEEIKEYEKVAFPFTIQEVITQIAEKKKVAEEIQKQRQDEILKKYQKLEQWKKELSDKIIKKEAEAKAAQERKDRLVEEVRRHFGFKIDPRDDRFKEMLEQKEKAEKKALKEQKRKLKEAKLMAKLQENKVEESNQITNKQTVNVSEK